MPPLRRGGPQSLPHVCSETRCWQKEKFKLEQATDCTETPSPREYVVSVYFLAEACLNWSQPYFAAYGIFLRGQGVSNLCNVAMRRLYALS